MENIKTISATRLILNPDGSIYHLAVKPGELAPHIILVGDPERVPMVSQFFDDVTIKRRNREHVTHTGRIGKLPLSVVSTGVGVGNIDIVMNELDALFNIDFTTRQVKEEITRLRILRLGTAGALQADIAVDSFVMSHAAMASDGLMSFYNYELSSYEQQLQTAVQQYYGDRYADLRFYVAQASTSLLTKFSVLATAALTFTCVGFYGPQHRELRAPIKYQDALDHAQQFAFDGLRIVNFEMETAAIYALANLLGHDCCSLSTIINNRVRHEFSKDYQKAVLHMISSSLQLLSDEKT